MTHNKSALQVTWIVLANSVEAKLYQVDGDKAHLFKTLEHPESRLKSKDLASDKSGSYKTSHAVHGHFVPADNPHKDEHDNFAREIAQLLENHRQKNDFNKLILCAEPHFCGFLNKHIGNQIQKLLKKTIEKDYIPLPNDKITKVLNEMIQEYIL